MNLYAELELEKVLAKACPRRARIILFAKVADELVIRCNHANSGITRVSFADKLDISSACVGRRRTTRSRASTVASFILERTACTTYVKCSCMAVKNHLPLQKP